MFGFRKSTANKDTNPGQKRTSSEPNLHVPHNSFDDDYEGRGTSSSSTAKDKYKNDFRDSEGLENQSVQELENYAVYKAEDTTNTVNNCVRIAEDMRQDATRTLDMLHSQGEQITRTHMMAVDMDKDLRKVISSFIVLLRIYFHFY